MGRFPEAMEEARTAQQLDPLSLAINTTLAGRCRDLGQYAQSMDLSRRTLEMDPGFVPAHIALGSTYESQRMWPQAITEYQKAVELSHNSPPGIGIFGLCLWDFRQSKRGHQDSCWFAGSLQASLRRSL